jgi:tetratricopeptide (TPR) repeat protein
MENLHSEVSKLPQLLTSVYNSFRKGDIQEAQDLLDRALSINFDHEEVINAMKIAAFWSDRIPGIREIEDPFEQGEKLFREWRGFIRFLSPKTNSHPHLSTVEDAAEPGVHAIKQWVFASSLEAFELVRRASGMDDPEILKRIGKSYKGIGDYVKAAEILEAALKLRKEDAQLLVELADCYAFLNEIRLAKVFFREAFYVNPQDIDIECLESLLIRNVIASVLEKGFSGDSLLEWIPVYAVVFGVFNIKRELRPVEIGTLKQNIYQLEQKLQTEPDNPLLVPRLINKYFWLIDHHLHSKDNRDRIDEVLNKIRNLNTKVYEEYVI